MKKIVTLLIMLVLSLSLIGCSSSSDFNSVEKIKENGELVLLTESGFPPFEYVSNEEGSVNNIAGVDVEFAKALAEKLGVKLTIIDMDFNSLTTALAANKGDIVAAGLTSNPKRAKIVDFSKTYFDNGLVILSLASDSYNSVEELEGKKISVQQGTTGNDFADSIENVEVLTFKGMIEAGLAIKNGNSDLSIMDILPAQIIASQNPELVVSETIEKDEIAFAVGKGNASLLDVINELIDELNVTKQFDKWFEEHYDSLLEG